MKRIFVVFSLALFLFALAACQSASNAQPAIVPEVVSESLPPSPEIQGDAVDQTAIPEQTAEVRVALDSTFENAVSSRLLLSLGTLKLAETAMPVNSEQAAQLLMLWNALDNLTNSGTGADVEVTALLTQIENTMTSEQIVAINAMKLTQTVMQEWANANGISMGTGNGDGAGSGQGRGLSAEERAARQAEQGVDAGQSGSNGLSSAINEALINYLAGVQ